MSIRTRLQLYFLLVLIIPVAVLSFVLLRNSQINLQDQIVGELEAIANERKLYITDVLRKQDEVTQTIAGRTSFVEQVAQYTRIPSTAQQEVLHGVLVDALSGIDRAHSITLYDGAHHVIASISKNATKVTVPPVAIFSARGDSHDVLTADADGGVSVHSVMPVVFNTIPIGYVDLVFRSDVLASVVGPSTGLGRTGEVLLMMADGDSERYVFNRRFEHVANIQANDGTEAAKVITDILGGTEQTYSNVLDYRGVEVVAVGKKVQDTNIGLLTKIDVAEAYAPVRNVSIATIVIAFFSILLSMLIAFIVSRSITEPLQKLAVAVQSVSGQGLKAKIRVDDIEREGEVGILVDAFSDLTSRLRDYYKDLDETVRKRTTDLAQKNKRLEALDADLTVRMKELERMNNLMVGRELTMMKLKQEIVALKAAQKKT